MAPSLSLSVDDLPRTEADRRLRDYLAGRIDADRLKADLYVGNTLHRARQLLQDDAQRYRSLDPARFDRLRRMLAVDDPRGAEAFLA